MKKFFFLLTFAVMSVTGMAQNESTGDKYAVVTNPFWSNWFVQANVGYEAFYSDQEKGLGFSKSPFKSFRSNVSPSLAIGKWFTPGFGLRTKITGLWGRTIYSDDASTNAMKFMNIQEQLLFNASNLLCGYNEDRFWNLIPYVGVGFLRNFDANENTHGVSLGLLNTFKIARRLDLNFELSFNMADDDVDGVYLSHDRYATSVATSDRYFTAEIGVTYKLGRCNWKKPTDGNAAAINEYKNTIEQLNARLEAASQATATAAATAAPTAAQHVVADYKRPEPKHVVDTVVVKDMIPVPIYFPINKYNLPSQNELLMLKALAKIHKDKKFVINGYADSYTGKADHNKWLSQKRAETVANELVKLGVSRDNIEIISSGGVSQWGEPEFNRCVYVEVK
jgi:outer membrane protein OmpA-like peptidoglycan-associated protein